MFFLLNIILSLAVSGFNLINGKILKNKPYYISSQISDTHRSFITDAMNIIQPFKKLEIQEYYDNNCIRIHYSNLRYTGFTDFKGYLNNDNEWIITNIDIGINPNIEYYNVFVLIMTHELLHSIGCMHSDVPNSIMNVSLLVVNGVIEDTEYPILNQDDLECVKKSFV